MGVGAVKFVDCALGVRGVGVGYECGALGAAGTVVEELQGGDGTDAAEEAEELFFAEVVVEVGYL